MLVENVQRQGGYHGVPHGILLIQVSGIEAGLGIEPRTPLVQQQGYAALRVIGVHNGLVVSKHLVHFHRLGQGVIVFFGREIQGRSLAAAPSLASVIVKGQAVHLGGGILHHHAGPVVVVVRCTASHLEQAVAAVVAGIKGVALVHVGIIIRRHIATAAPALIAHAQVFHLPGFLAAVFGTQLGHRSILGRHIFHPLGQFLHGAGAHVAADIRLRAQHLTQVQELVRAEGVVFHGASPIIVHQLGAVLTRAYAVHPMVLVGKAAAGPAQDRNFQGLEGLQDIRTVAVDIGDVTIGTHPDTFVDASAQMLGKLSVNLGRDNGLVLGRFMDGNFHLRLEGKGCDKGRK